MRNILMVMFILTTTNVYPEMMEVKTGIGYIKDIEGRIVCKYDLPKGQHPLKDGYTYVEVENYSELDKIIPYSEPIKNLTTEEKLGKIGITKKELMDLLK